MKLSIFLILVLSYSLNVHSQSKLIFSQSKGKLNTGGTPDLMDYDTSSKRTSLLYKGVVKGRGEYSASVSPDKARILLNTYQFGGWKLGIADYTNGRIGAFRKFTSRSNYEYNAKWSNNGNSVAYQDFSWSTRDTEIYIADKFGKNAVRFTKSDGGDRNPCWSTDDRSIVYTSGRKDNYDIYIQSIDDNKVINVTDHPSNDFAPSTSKKEDKIAFLSDREGYINLYVMDYGGKGLTNLTSNLKTDPINFDGFENSGYWAYQTSWSDGGEHIVFNLMVDSNLEIFTIKKDGSKLTRITDNQDSDFCPTWVN